MDPHPHPERSSRPFVGIDCFLGRNGRIQSARCRREDSEEGVPFRADRRAATVGDGTTQDGVMVLLEPAVSLAKLPQPAGRSLDIGEEKRHRPCREVG